VDLTLWDTSGQERYTKMSSSYYRSSNAVIIAYDLTSRDTLEKAMEFAKQAIQLVRCPAVFAFWGFKLDLIQFNAAKREVTQEDIDHARHDLLDMAKAEDEFRNLDPTIVTAEISSKINIGVDSAFRDLARAYCSSIPLNRQWPMIRFRWAHNAHRDAVLAVRAAKLGYPIELKMRLKFGGYAGAFTKRTGSGIFSRKKTILEHATFEGHDRCVAVIKQEMARWVKSGKLPPSTDADSSEYFFCVMS